MTAQPRLPPYRPRRDLRGPNVVIDGSLVGEVPQVSYPIDGFNQWEASKDQSCPKRRIHRGIDIPSGPPSEASAFPSSRTMMTEGAVGPSMLRHRPTHAETDRTFRSSSLDRLRQKIYFSDAPILGGMHTHQRAQNRRSSSQTRTSVPNTESVTAFPRRVSSTVADRWRMGFRDDPALASPARGEPDYLSPRAPLLSSCPSSARSFPQPPAFDRFAFAGTGSNNQANQPIRSPARHPSHTFTTTHHRNSSPLSQRFRSTTNNNLNTLRSFDAMAPVRSFDTPSRPHMFQNGISHNAYDADGYDDQKRSFNANDDPSKGHDFLTRCAVKSNMTVRAVDLAPATPTNLSMAIDRKARIDAVLPRQLFSCGGVLSPMQSPASIQVGVDETADVDELRLIVRRLLDYNRKLRGLLKRSLANRSQASCPTCQTKTTAEGMSMRTAASGVPRDATSDHRSYTPEKENMPDARLPSKASDKAFLYEKENSYGSNPPNRAPHHSISDDFDDDEFEPSHSAETRPTAPSDRPAHKQASRPASVPNLKLSAVGRSAWLSGEATNGDTYL